MIIKNMDELYQIIKLNPKTVIRIFVDEYGDPAILLAEDVLFSMKQLIDEGTCKDLDAVFHSATYET